MTEIIKHDNLLQFLLSLAELQSSQLDDGEQCVTDAEIVTLSPALLSAVRKRRYGMLAVLGDSVLDLLVAEFCAHNGSTVQSCQQARASLCSDVALGRVFVDSGLSSHVSFVSDVPLLGKPGATALEAMFGFIYIHARGVGMTAVRRMALNLKVVSVNMGIE